MSYQLLEQVTNSSDIYEEYKLEEISIDKSSLVSKTALELFGAQHEYLTAKLEFKKKLECGAMAIPFTSIGVTLGCFIAGAITRSDDLFLATIYSMLAGASTMSVPILTNALYANVATEFIRGADLVTAFSNSFENFKSNPEEYKAMHLFTEFANLNGKWLELIQSRNILQKDQIGFFRSIGQIFLMDAICVVLKKNKLDKGLVKIWNEVKEINPLSQPYIDFWKDAGLLIPSCEAHSQFRIMSGFIKSTEIANKTNELFLYALKRSIDEKFI